MVRELLSNHWRPIKILKPELIPVLLNGCRDTIYCQATGILDRELGDKWGGLAYEIIRSKTDGYGYSDAYLMLSQNSEQFSSSAKIPIMIELAKLDLQVGTSIPELVLNCCRFLPAKEALQKIIGKETQSEESVAKSIFEFENHENYDCLIGLFHTATRYKNLTENYPSGPMLSHIEESFFFLVELARANNLELDQIFNRTTKNGGTLFDKASTFSENITRFLLEENVKVNSIDDFFRTPYFRVRPEIIFR